MSNMSKRKKFSHFKDIGTHDEFLNRISKTLYYAKLPTKNCLTLPMTELAAELFTDVKKDHTLERLEIEEASRISRNACVSPCSMVLALLYIERLKDCNPEYLKRVANSELFLVTLLVASKFLHDDGEEGEVLNADWANSGDVSVSEMNRLEQEFLQAINWSIFVKTEDFWNKLAQLERHLAQKEASKRGWFSYTELNSLLSSAQLLSMISYLLNVYSVCIAAYTAGLVTLLGSALIASYVPGTALSPANHQKVTRTEIQLNHQISSENSPEMEFNVDLFGEENLVTKNVTRNFTRDFSIEKSENLNWWLSSMLNYFQKQNEIRHLAPKSSQITRVEFDDVFHQSLRINIDYRENIGSNLKFLFYDWRY